MVPFHFGKWQKSPEIQYVLVFRQPKQDVNYIYEANLWYQRNEHFNVYESDIKAPAFKMGENIVKILNVKLLETTEPNNFRWVNLK